MEIKTWGKELIIDLENCTHDFLIDEEYIRKFLIDLTDLIGMKRFGEPQVHRFGEGTLEGITGVQLLYTSSIVIHCDEVDNRVFINIFSCCNFDTRIAEYFCRRKFNGQVRSATTLERK
jgi:S-adenosylmethionine/arginine decarboxylase-like enzyme